MKKVGAKRKSNVIQNIIIGLIVLLLILISLYFIFFNKAESISGNVIRIDNWGYAGGNAIANPGDYDGDGTEDLTIWDPLSSKWYIKSLNGNVLGWEINFGFNGVQVVPGDYDGDGKSDLAVYCEKNCPTNAPNLGTWYIRSLAGKVIAWNVSWGYSETQAVAGDYDGDGKSDLAVYGLKDGKWYIYSIAKNQVIAWEKQHGFAGAVPFSGDFDGDNINDLAVYHSGTRQWYILSLDGRVLAWKNPFGIIISKSEKIVIGDFDGDGADDLGLVDESGRFIARNLAGSIIGDNKTIGFGMPVPGDFNGDGYTELATYNSTGGWYIIDNAVLKKPVITDAPRYCTYLGSCNKQVSININNAGNHDLVIRTTYVHNDGTKNIRSSKVSLTSQTYSFMPFLNDSTGKIVESASIKVSVKKGENRSLWSAPIDLIVNYSCQHGCVNLGEKICSGNFATKTCGNYDSDACLEWSVNTNCDAGESCNNGECELTGFSDTCDESRGEFCSPNSQTAGSEVDGGSCTLANEKCYTCNSGYHEFNKTCVSNSCLGNAPSTINGTITGLNYTEGEETTWTYSRYATSSSICLWKCDEDFHREGNACAFGYPQCSELSSLGEAGCRNTSVSLANSNVIVKANCTEETYSCYECAAGFIWNGTACKTCTDTCTSIGGKCSSEFINNAEINQTAECCDGGGCFVCSGNYRWNGELCEYNPCSANQCFLNACLNPGIRVNDGGIRKYCSNGVLVAQKDEGESCTQSFECSTNYCSNEGECLDVLSQTEETRSLATNLVCWFRRLFGGTC